MWDFSRYNVIVKQVEGCSDLLRDVADRIKPFAKDDPDRIAPALIRNLEEAISELDVRALRMLSLYDVAAKAMLEDGMIYDPRRDMFKTQPRLEAPQRFAEAGEGTQTE